MSDWQIPPSIPTTSFQHCLFSNQSPWTGRFSLKFRSSFQINFSGTIRNLLTACSISSLKTDLKIMDSPWTWGSRRRGGGGGKGWQTGIDSYINKILFAVSVELNSLHPCKELIRAAFLLHRLRTSFVCGPLSLFSKDLRFPRLPRTWCTVRVSSAPSLSYFD